MNIYPGSWIDTGFEKVCQANKCAIDRWWVAAAVRGRNRLNLFFLLFWPSADGIDLLVGWIDATGLNMVGVLLAGDFY